MKTKIEDLREHLFATLESLRDTEAPMDIARAKAIADVAGRIIDSAKAEIEYARVTGCEISTGFLPPAGGRQQLPALGRGPKNGERP